MMLGEISIFLPTAIQRLPETEQESTEDANEERRVGDSHHDGGCWISCPYAGQGGPAPTSLGSLTNARGLDPTTGVISGTPTSPGTNSFEITVTDHAGATDEATLSLVVNKPPTCSGNPCAVADGDGLVTIEFDPTPGICEFTWDYFVSETWFDGTREEVGLNQDGFTAESTVRARYTVDAEHPYNEVAPTAGDQVTFIVGEAIEYPESCGGGGSQYGELGTTNPIILK